MPAAITDQILREVDPLGAEEPIGSAVRRVIDAGLPALPVAEEDGSFAGIFGEREFIVAVFPGYLGQLGSAAMVTCSLDATIERRDRCRGESIRPCLTTDHVVVEDDCSDTALAELFLRLKRRISKRGRGLPRDERPSSDGCMVGLRQKGHSGGPVDRLLGDLAEHFEIACSESDPGLYMINVDYARFPDEAVVKVVCALDGIDAEWQGFFAWPESIDSHAEGDEGPAA